jgi:plasmid stabilization system protein ParE
VSDYVLGSDAVLDLEDIWDYIATDSETAADRWVAKLFDAFEEIACMPGIGHRRQDLTAFPVLFWTVGAYLIIYRLKKGCPVEIVAVTQGSRDIPSFLRRRLS